MNERVTCRLSLPLAIALGLLSLRADAQEAFSHPRVGIALGGGSARGVAHVGVLKWLDEHRIPVDAVAGTSMGAFVGAALAAGMSPTEIQSIFADEDWDVTLQRDLGYSQKSFRRKEDNRAFPVKLDLGLRHGLRLQSGLNSGHRMGLMLSRIFLPYSTVRRFDDLAIPFRCVATDLEAGESVVLDQGSLALALRASMALPGTFDAVEIDGRLLADGGILNNIPVDVAKSMNVDVVIAVSVSAPKRDRPTESIQAIANRAIRLMMQDLDRPRLEQADVVILPDVDGVRAHAFRETEDLVRRGYEAAEAQSVELMRYALPAEEYERRKIARRQRVTRHTGSLAFVDVKGVSDAGARQIAERIQLDLNGGTPPNAETIDAQLDWVVGHGRYASATYERRVEDGREGLAVVFNDKSYAPPLVKFALDLDNENEDINLSFGSRVTFMDVTSLGSELRLDFSVGSTLRVGTELFQPLGGDGSMRRGFFAAPQAAYARTSENFYVGDDLAAVYSQHKAAVGLDIGFLFGRHTQLRGGFETAFVRNAARVGGVVPQNEGEERSLHFRFNHEGQDRAYFPTSGIRVATRGTWFLEVPDYPFQFGRVEGLISSAWRAGSGRHVTVYADGGASLGNHRPPSLYEFPLGGPFRLGAFPTNKLRGRHFGLLGIAYRFQLARLPALFGDRMYATALVEGGSAFDQFRDADIKASLTVGLSTDTILGPLFIGASVGQARSVRAYFMVGTQVR